MPKTKYNWGAATKRKHKLNFSKLKTISLVAACLLFVVFLAGISSGFLTVGSISLSSLYKGNNSIKEQTMYVLSMDRFSDIASAEKTAELLALQGASAYVWEINNWHEIVGNVYLTKNEAEGVKGNISASNPNVRIVAITFPKISVNNKNLTNEQKLLLKESLNYLGVVCENLYEFGINIETKEKSPTTISGLVNNLKSECSIRGNKLDLLNSVTLTEEGLQIKNTYIKVVNCLNELMLKLIEGDSLNHVSKFTYVQVLKLKYDLFQILQ